MSIEERFDQLIIENIAYWKVDGYEVDGYTYDDNYSSTIVMNNNHDTKQLFKIHFKNIWCVLIMEYPETILRDERTSRRMECYNFMDIKTTAKLF